MENFEYLARCAYGFEPYLSRELKNLGLKQVRPLQGGVAFYGSIEDAYRACLWSRIASRILLVLARIEAGDADALYKGVTSINWTSHIDEEASIAIYAHGRNANLRNSQFIALKTKDAICDHIRELRGSRPDVETERPSLVINVSLRDNKARVSLDLSGEALHRRGYREEGIQSVAPLKETLAALLLVANDWDSLAKQGRPFADPMCGSATIAIEAAMIACDKAPGMLRDYWGFLGWKQHDATTWNALINEAQQRFDRGLKKAPKIIALDKDEKVLELGRANSERAGFGEVIEFYRADASELSNYLDFSEPGLIVSNPPYGVRLGTQAELGTTYQALSQLVASLTDGWKLSLLSSNDDLDLALGLVSDERIAIYNGALEVKLSRYSIEKNQIEIKLPSLSGGAETSIFVHEKNSEQFAARLIKNFKARKKLCRRQGISSYRIYDADLPDYSFAIDYYEGADNSARQQFLHIAEYQAPKTVDAKRAQHRAEDLIKIAPALLSIPENQVFTKVRRRDKGGFQYREQGISQKATIEEGGYLFEVDFGAHLDTGIFLDHRITRKHIGDSAKGRRFLNLFAYTGTATVYAAGGGAESTTSVDLSHSYLDWAKRNMMLNSLDSAKHSFVHADVLQWIQEEIEKKVYYDLIFVDPPTFSNSKSMEDASWSVQRDHVRLLTQVNHICAENGLFIFSCNLRNFKPDHEALTAAGIRLVDISAETIPEDFKRNAKIHHCYLVERL